MARKRMYTVFSGPTNGSSCLVKCCKGSFFEKRASIPIHMSRATIGLAFRALSAFETVDFLNRCLVSQVISAHHLSGDAVPVYRKRRYRKIDAVIQMRKEDIQSTEIYMEAGQRTDRPAQYHDAATLRIVQGGHIVPPAIGDQRSAH